MKDAIIRNISICKTILSVVFHLTLLVCVCLAKFGTLSFCPTVGYKGLWYRKQHKSVREKCLSLIAKYFNGMPFDYSALKVTHVFQEEETPLLDSPAAAASVIDHNQRSETDANNKQKL